MRARPVKVSTQLRASRTICVMRASSSVWSTFRYALASVRLSGSCSGERAHGMLTGVRRMRHLQLRPECRLALRPCHTAQPLPSRATRNFGLMPVEIREIVAPLRARVTPPPGCDGLRIVGDDIQAGESRCHQRGSRETVGDREVAETPPQGARHQRYPALPP